MPKFFGRVHPKFRTPSTGTVVTGACAAIVGGLFPVGILGELVSIGTLLAFVTVCIGVLVLRYTRPELPRPFKAPWPWFTCVAGALICLADDGRLAHQHLDTACGLDDSSARWSTRSTATTTAGAAESKDRLDEGCGAVSAPIASRHVIERRSS